MLDTFRVEFMESSNLILFFFLHKGSSCDET